MQKRVFRIALVGQLLMFAPGATAQDYRGRVQGSVLDSTQGALPGTTVTMVNDATGVAVTFVADRDGHYIFDFVDPGMYTITGELEGFKKAQQRNVRVAQRSSVTADLMLEIGGLEERVVVEAAPVSVQFKSSSSDLTLERQLVDQVPINGRNPFGRARTRQRCAAARSGCTAPPTAARSGRTRSSRSRRSSAGTTNGRSRSCAPCRPNWSGAAISASRCSTAACAASTTPSRQRSMP